MPLDPSIILGVRPAQIPLQDPLDRFNKSLTLQHLMGQNDLSQLQMQQAKLGLEDDAAVRRAYQQAGGDSARLRALLQGGGQYKALQTLDKFDLEKREKESVIGKNETESAIKKAEHAASILSVAKDDPATYPAVRRLLQMQYPQLHARLPEQYDPAAVNGEIAAGMTYVQKLAAAQKDREITETGRHNKAAEGGAAAALAETTRHNKYGEQNPALQHVETSDGTLGAFNPRTGSMAPVVGADGRPVQGGKNLTESQGKATGMALRAQQAHDILRALEDGGTKTPGIIKQGAAAVPVVGGALAMGVNALPSVLGGPSSEQNRVEQAQRDFVNAVLRVESGASISESEFNNARKQYFPQPGDDAATIAQKRQNRETAIQALKLQAGPGAKNVVSKTPDKAPEAPKSDPSKMTDEDLKKALGIS
jgi:hypothetical protein